MLLNTTPIADLAAYRSTFGDMSSMYTDPMLEADSFILQNGSPAINAGVVLPEVPFDINGTLRELPDIGCYEYILLSLDSPQNVRIINVDGALQLTWDPVPGANLYTIYFADTPDALHWDAISMPGTTMNLNPPVNARFFKVIAVYQ